MLVLPDSGGGIPSNCGPGTSARMGQTGCVTIGPTSCPMGFVASGSGWGCQAVQSSTPCTGTTRAELGQTTCVPVDECTAPFPPAGAAVVVSPTGTVTTISAALTMVPSGATIAVDSGTYNESLTLTQDVTIIGRCASEVTVDAGGLRGVFASGFFNATLQSLTVNGGMGGLVAASSNLTASHLILLNNATGVLAGYGGTVVLQSSLIDGGGQANSPTSLDAAVTVLSGSQATLTDVEVRNFSPAVEAYDASSVVTLDRSLVSYLGPAETTTLMSAWTGSKIVVTGSVLSTLQAGIFSIGAALPNMSGPPASISVTSSELAQSGYNREYILLSVGAGATATIDQTTIHYQSRFAFFASDQGTSATITNSVIEGDPTFDVARVGMQVAMGATVEMDDSAVVASIQDGILVGDSGSSLTLMRDLVTGTMFVGPGPDAKLQGAGIAIGAGNATRVTLTDTSLVANEQFGLYLEDGSVGEVSGLLVDGTKAAAQPGSAVLVESGGQLALTGGSLQHNAESALACVTGGALVGKTNFVGNSVALAVDSSVVVQASSAPAAPSMTSVILYDNQYNANATLEGPPPTYLPGT